MLRFNALFRKAVYAHLVTEVGRTIEEVAELSPFQKFELYFHARTKDGSLKWPERPMPVKDSWTLEEELAVIDGLVSNQMIGLSPAQAEVHKAFLRAKYAAKTNGQSPK